MMSLPHHNLEHQRTWLQQYTRIVLVTLVPILAIQIVGALIGPTWRAFSGLVLTTVLVVALVSISRMGPTQQLPRFAAGLCWLQLMLGLLGLLVTPVALPILIQVPLVTLLAGLPCLRGKQFSILLAGTTLSVGAMVLIGQLSPQEPPSRFSQLAIASTTALAVVGVAVLLLQYHRWLSMLLDETTSANAALAASHSTLEAQVRARTNELVTREQRYRAISGLTCDYMLTLDVLPDQSLQLAWVSDRFTQITGYAPELLLTRAGRMQLIHPDDQALTLACYQAIIGGESRVWDARLVTAFGTTLWIRNFVQPIADDASGRIVHLMAAAKDITAQKQAEQAITRQADQRHRLLEIGQLILSGRSPDEIYRQIGRSLQAVLPFDEFGIFWLDREQGVLQSSWLNSDAWQVTRPTSFTLQLGEGFAGQVAQTGRALLVNNAHRDPTSRYPAHFTPHVDHLMALPLQEEGVTVATLSINRYADPPFTEEEFEHVQLFVSFLSLALTNASLLGQSRASEQRYRQLFEESIDVIYTTNPAGQVLDINPAGIELLGYDSLEELLRCDVANDLYVDPQEREVFKQAIAAHGQIKNIETRRRHKDGRIVHVEESATAIRDEQGAIVAYLGYLRDITDRKQAEETLRRVMAGVRCLLWHATVAERAEESARRHPFSWNTRIFNEVAAEQHFPVRRLPHQSYTDAWMAARDPGDAQDMDALSAQALREGRPGYSQEFRYRGADGNLRWLTEEVWISPAGPGRWELVGVCIDITDRKRDEEALNRQVAELERHTREITALNRMGEQLQICNTEEEACLAAAHGFQSLFPGHAGAIYLGLPDAEHLPRVACWDDQGLLPPAISAGDCPVLRPGAAGGPGDASHCTACGERPICLDETSLALPVMDQGRVSGLVVVQRGVSPGEARFGDLLAAGVRSLELAIANLRLRETLRRQAIRDPLTGLFNRRYMEESLERELHRLVRRPSAALGLIMLDIDFFKQINDEYGHAVGDTLLRELGQFLLENTRVADIACRYGGEEFILILPESSLADTQRRAEQLCAQIRGLAVDHQQLRLPPITVSIGLAAFPEHGEHVDELLYQADKALYRAKALGRNQVVVGQRAPADLPISTTI